MVLAITLVILIIATLLLLIRYSRKNRHASVPRTNAKPTNEKIKRFFRLTAVNLATFFAPFLMAWMDSGFKHMSVFNENGAGAILWIYILLAPACLIAQLVFIIQLFISSPTKRNPISKQNKD